MPCCTGYVNKDFENNLFKYSNACAIFCDLKNTHVSVIKKNVNAIFKVSKIKLDWLSFFFFENIIVGMINKPFNNPQAIKVQLAPCHKPLNAKTISVFKITLLSVPLLPPKGIYT